jgi:hypothetical protein
MQESVSRTVWGIPKFGWRVGSICPTPASGSPYRRASVADRWVFGARPTKYEAITDFGVTIEQDLAESQEAPD